MFSDLGGAVLAFPQFKQAILAQKHPSAAYFALPGRAVRCYKGAIRRHAAASSPAVSAREPS